jgi:phosphatidylglycerophosphate synthase
MTLTTYIALFVAFGFLLTMPVYAVVARRRPVDADVARRPTTPLLGLWVRDWLMWLITPVERTLVRTGVSPDALNYVGGLLGLGAGIAYANGDIAVGGWLVLLGGLADILDGRIARARGIGSNYGEFLDSMVDRFAEMFAFMGLALYFEPSRWMMLSTVVALGGSMMVSYARAKGEGVGVDCRGGIMQRAERLVLLAAASLTDHLICDTFDLPESSVLITVVTLIGFASVGTAIWRSWVIARELKRRGE